MSFVNAVDMTQDAYKNHYAIGAFNTNNLEWTRCILKGAQDTNTPVIIQVSMGAAKYMGGKHEHHCSCCYALRPR